MTSDGTKPVEEGAQIIVRMAELDQAGPSGTFTEEQGAVPLVSLVQRAGLGLTRSFGETLFAKVRLLPAGSVTLAVSRSDSLRSRARSRRSGLGSLSLTVFRACGPTPKAFAFNATRRLRDTVTRLVVRPETLPLTAKPFAFETVTLT